MRIGWLTVYDSVQHVYAVQSILAAAFGIGAADVRVIAPHTGGGFVTLPVNADIPATIDIAFVDEFDAYAGPLGAKGIGELSATGVAAAVANAVFDATGKRIRELPITPGQLLDTAL